MLLTSDQLTHVGYLVDTLKDHNIAIDTSTTGSGKTVTSLEVAVRLSDDNPVVVAPKSLHAQWLRVASTLFPTLRIQLESSDSIQIPSTNHLLMIVDECHYFKNLSKRHYQLVRCMSTCKYVLLMSATPLDHSRHLTVVNRLVRQVNPVSTRTVDKYVFHMQYTPPRQCITYLYHMPMIESDTTMYDKGYRKLMSASHIRGDEANGDPSVFSGAYTKGLMQMHASLLPSLIQLTREYLDRVGKLIVVVRFREHVRTLMNEFPQGLVLTGDVPMCERSTITDLFQRPNPTPSLLIISSVGMTGINLDDTHGLYPRRILSLPIPTATEYMQLVGRVNRRFTKSTPTCIFVQPMRTTTLTRNILTSRVQILRSLFRSDPPKVYHKVHPCKCYVPNIEYVPIDIHRIISSFRCECKTLLT